MAISVIQEAITANDNTSATTVSVALTGTVAGNLIHVCFLCNNAAIDSVVDSDGNTYTSIAALNNNATTRKYRHWYAKNIVGNAGTTTITATLHFSINGRSGLAREIGGVDNSAPLLAHSENSQTTPTTSTDAVTTGTATNASQPALISGWTFNPVNTSVPTHGTGLTTGISGSNATIQSYCSESKRITSTTAIAATFTATSNVEHNSLMAIFRELGVTNFPLSATQGSYAMTGVDVTFVTSFTPNFYLFPASGTFDYVGAPASSDFEIGFDIGTYILTGLPAAFSLVLPTNILTAGFGNYSILYLTADFEIGSSITPAGTFPNLIGMNYYEAQDALQAVGAYIPVPAFILPQSYITARYTTGSQPAGVILTQSVPPGSPVTPNMAVTLIMNEFPTGVILP